MVYGYARVSTLGQARDSNSLEAQENALRQAGAERIYRDVYSGKPERRPQLDRLMKVIDYGDRLIITRLDHALELLQTHSYKQVERLTGISITTIYRAKLERAKRERLREALSQRDQQA